MKKCNRLTIVCGFDRKSLYLLEGIEPYPEIDLFRIKGKYLDLSFGSS